MNVTKKPCVLETCPTGEIQDLYTCGCVSLAESQGEVFNINTTEATHVRLDVGEYFTIREFAPTSNDYEWISPDYTFGNCVTVLNATEDPWFRYKQVVLETKSDDAGGCRTTMDWFSS